MKPRERFNPPIDKSKYLSFEVRGSGVLYVSLSPHHMCGLNNVGFSIRSTDSTYGEDYGGVLGRENAIRLAHHILETCTKITETEEQEYQRRINDRSIRKKFSDGVVKLFNIFSGGSLSTLENKN